MERILAMRDDQLGPATGELTIDGVCCAGKCLADEVVQACHLFHGGRRRGQCSHDFLPKTCLVWKASTAQRPEHQNTGLEPEIADGGLDAVDRGARDQSYDPHLSGRSPASAMEPKTVVTMKSV